MWTEKYRNYNENNIIFDKKIKKILSQIIITKNIPHLIIFGNPGLGKSTFVLTIAKILFYIDETKYRMDIFNLNDIDKLCIKYVQNEIYNNNILFLNAWNDRGIKIVRDKIKQFISFTQKNNHITTNFKLIVIDEADLLWLDCQHALRRIIEIYSNVARFILICNYKFKIIPAILSRCAKIYINNIKQIDHFNIINNIIIKENINFNNDNNITENIITNLYNYTNGDLRKWINMFQDLCLQFSLSNNNDSLIK